MINKITIFKIQFLRKKILLIFLNEVSKFVLAPQFLKNNIRVFNFKKCFQLNKNIFKRKLIYDYKENMIEKSVR